MKGIKKFIKMLKRSREYVSQIHVSEEFAMALKEKAGLLEITSLIRTEKDLEIEDFYLFGIKMTFSNIIKKGAILEMKDGSSIVVV